ncbi:MAG: hydroxypyruvate isomerase [Lentisphaerae bacterium RIFOXYA12_FULL_48_11]|nr:MAG: hydroxypyruvate isomerase [Lentisphaerae bacterium RIFOXYA12_FULL_48_11]
MIHKNINVITRRELLKTITGGAALTAIGLGSQITLAEDKPAQIKGRIKQAACGGVFGKVKMSFEEKCQLCVQIGLKGMDFIGENEWPTLKKYGLICTLTRSHSLTKGLNRKENHEECLAAIRKGIDASAEAGFPNVICFSGNRDGLADDIGADNCVEGLKKIASHAEEKKINVCMELLNSKRNHKDYQCDRTAWAVDISKKVGSPRIKVLYDIYHMQVQEGDVIATLKENIQYIAHIHTAGVPGRNEIDESQELYYPPIMQAIVDLKYEGYVAHEYTPKKDALASLRKAVQICDV